MPAMPIAVTIQDYPGLQPDISAKAINRFRNELERRLGNRLDAALKAFQTVSESGAEDLSKEEIGLADDYAKAYDAARTVGFRDMGDVQEAYFDVRLA